MLYADDIVLLAECETDLQLLLNALYDWYGQNDMTVNLAKSNVVHFRRNCVSKTDALFSLLRNGLNRAYCSVSARLKCQF